MPSLGKHWDPNYKIKVLDYTYTSQPSINTALPLVKSYLRLILFIIGCILSLGFLWLITKWSAKKKSLLIYSVCQLQSAEIFLIEEEDNRNQIVQRINKYNLKRQQNSIGFIYHERTYLYQQEKESFLPVRYQQLGVHLDQLGKDNFRPYYQNQRNLLLQYYNPNIIKLPIQNRIQIFIQEMITPYQVFQTYAIILWIIQQYYFFSFILLFYAIYTYWCNSTQVANNQKKLADQSYFDVECKILILGLQYQQDSALSDQQPHIIVSKKLVDSNNFHVIDDQLEPKLSIGEKPKERAQIIKLKGSSSCDVVPGDLIVLKEGDTVPCDCILLTNQILVNQSYTTGQHYLVRKTRIQGYLYSYEQQKSFTLYLGSKIIKKKKQKNIMNDRKILFNLTLQDNQVLCLVIATNYNTQRGKYLRAIRYQKKNQQTFTKQSIYFIYILIIITIIVFFINLTQIYMNQSKFQLFVIFLDMLATSIPPTLPTALSVGIKFAQGRLRSKGIHCVLPQNILTGGRTNTIILKGHQVFGKNYQVQSVIIGTKKQRGLGSVITCIPQYQQLLTKRNFIAKMFMNALGSCHTLQFHNNQIQGQPQQLELYKFSCSQFLNQDQFQVYSDKITVLKRIYFQNKDKKLAILAQIIHKNSMMKRKNQISHSLMDYQILPNSQQNVQNSNRVIFIKGPPQKILSICQVNSYPVQSYQYIVDMAQKGFLLLAYAFKQVRIHQEDINSKGGLNQKSEDYIFLGYAVLRRIQHNDSKQAIMSLKRANINVLFISQERQLQTNSVAILNHISTKQQLISCSLNKTKDQIFCRGHTQWQSSIGNKSIDQFIQQAPKLGNNSKFSIASSLYQQLFMKKYSFLQIFNKCIIFNRMQSKHQKNLYHQLQLREKVCFTVGGQGIISDSSNVSIELERGQSSLLSSFYTQQNSLNAIINCLKICRAGLSTNFHCFNMMILFSLTQFTTVAILQYNYQTLSDSQSLYQDLFVTFPIFITLNMTKPASKLSRQRPFGSFFSSRALTSMIGIFVLQVFAQVTFIIYLIEFSTFGYEKSQAYQIYLKNGNFTQTSLTVHSIFILSNYLYLGIVLSTSVSTSFRKPFYTNPFYTINLVLLWIYNTLIVFVPAFAPGQFRSRQLTSLQESILILALVYGNLMMVVMYLFQHFVDWIGLICSQKGENEQIVQN